MSADVIERLNAALSGRYAIEGELGEGGMATVYLAQDEKHDRQVAVKVLRPELAAMVGAERFLAEIKTTANLQHPHILPLFDSGEADSFLFYVMPYVAGETLRTRIEREKQLSVDEALAITRKIASALDYAHGQGVVHRDIKPANVLLSEQGEPLVADFGIALAVAQAGAGRITETGLSLGTPHYMSPEQATGDRDIDPRSDVYALGCVLYEMLAGRPPFSASTAQAILVQILTADVAPVTTHRRTVPPHIDGALTRALEKLPADRFRTVAEFSKALDDETFSYQVRPKAGTAATTQIVAAAPVAASTHPWLRDPRSLAALAALVLVGAVGFLRPTPDPVPGVPTKALVTGLDVNPGVGGWRRAISPDGKWIVSGGSVDGTRHLFIRPASDPEWRRLPNTEGASNPDFSPDGQSVAFDGEGLHRVPITGGPRLPIVESGSSPHWTVDDEIVYHDGRGSVYRVNASGGEPVLLFQDDSIFANRPHLLPNGKGVLFGENTGGDPLQSRVLLYVLETGELRVLVPSGNQPRYVQSGHVVYAHGDQALMGVPFDLETLERTGSPVTLLPRMAVRTGGAAQFDVADNGTLIYDAGSPGNRAGPEGRTLVEVGMDGTVTPLPLGAGALDRPRYAPDGRSIAFEDGEEIRIYDVVTGASPQITSGGGFYPEWGPSGAYLYFAGGSTLLEADTYRRPADASENATRLFERPLGQYVNDVAPGDSVLLVRENTDDRARDILIVRLGSDGAVFENFLTAEWNEASPHLSPDGKWMAYESDESGEVRIYVQSFPVATGKRAVSPGLGADPVWSPDGSRIYYRSDARFMAVDVSTEPTFTAYAPEALFEASWYDPRGVGRGFERGWDLHPDGDRFILVRSEADGAAVQSTGASVEVYLVVNWFEELKERMGG